MDLPKIKSNISALVHYENSLNRFNAYIDSLPIDKQTKARLKDSNFIEKNFSFYLCYPYLFSSAFNLDEDKLADLTVAGYLYYKSIIYMDEMVDKNKMSMDSLTIIAICQEESIKLLSSIFPLHSPFWNYWNQRRSEYAKAYHIDKVSHQVHSFKEFETHAGNKSAFGKVAIDALYVMSQNKDHKLHKSLIKSHDLFYTAFQIIDDIHDLRQDTEHKQFNIASYSFAKEFGKIEGNPEIIAKGVYLSGTATKLLEKGLEALAEAEAIIKIYPLEGWGSEVRNLHNIIVTQVLNIKGYIKNIVVKERLSHQILNTPLSTENCIYKGVDFLTQFQNKDGSWQDFFNDAGLSDTWATSYVLSTLPEKYWKEKIAEKAYAFLHNGQNGLWGYNKQWIPDADSSTFAILTYFHRNNNVNPKLLYEWLTFQKKDGGFSTYNDRGALLSSLSANRKIDNIEGWIQSHPCVSAAAFYLLSVIGEQSEPFLRLKEFILSQQKSNGLWGAYWWTSSIYSTTFIIKSCNYEINKDMASKRKKALAALMQLQNKNGSFGDSIVSESPFYTALVVEAICQMKETYPIFYEEISKSVEWLRSTQYDDGSWKETPSMRMPAPDVITPSARDKWEEGTRGLNIRVSDFNGLYSTVTAVSALANYEKWIK